MKLLDAQKVKIEKDAKENEKEARIKKLQKMEDVLILRINNLRELKTQEEEKSQPKLKVKKNILVSEVEALEARKLEALKPTNKIRLEAENKLKEVSVQIADIIRRQGILEKTEEELIERTESVIDRETALLDVGKELDKKEVGIKKAEEEIKRQNESVAKSWVSYNEEVLEAKKLLEIREKGVEAKEKANAVFGKELDAKEIKLMQPVEVLIKEAEDVIQKNKLESVSLEERKNAQDKSEISLQERIDKFDKEDANLAGRNMTYTEKEMAAAILSNNLESKENKLNIKEEELQKEIISHSSRVTSDDRRILNSLKANDGTRTKLAKLYTDYTNAIHDTSVEKVEVIKQKSSLEIQQKGLDVRKEGIITSERNQVLKRTELDSRENKTALKEEGLRSSLISLAKERSTFEETKVKSEFEVSRREKEVEDTKKVNENYKISLDKQSEEIKQEKIAIQDKYKTLERSRSEILGSKK